MKCFNHSDTESVGICRNCGKSVCKDCLFFSRFPIGLVCCEDCYHKIQKLENSFEENQKLKPEFENERLKNNRIIAQNEREREKTVQLYANLARQEKLSFYFCGAISFAMFGYCGVYAKFFDWYFCFGLGIILLVFAFNSHNRSDVYKKYAAEFH